MEYTQSLKKLLKISISFGIILFLICFFYLEKISNSRFLQSIIYPISCEYEVPFWLHDLIPNFQNNGYSGIQISYIKKNRKINHCSIGWASLFPLRRLNNSDEFMYASISKVFTSALILQATDEKIIALDDRLTTILNLKSLSKDDLDKITITHLLQHRAGFDRKKSGDLIFTFPDLCSDQLYKLPYLKLDFKPGTDFSYSNFGYCLLGEVLKIKYKKNLINIYEDKLFAPAFVKISHIKDNQGTVKYFYSKFDQPLSRELMNKNFTAFGGFVGSAKNYAQVINYILKNNYVKNKMLGYQNNCIMDEFYKCHGLTFYTYKEKGKKIAYWRDGSLPGVSTFFMLLEDDSFLILLANSRSENPQKDHIELGKKIYKILN